MSQDFLTNCARYEKGDRVVVRRFIQQTARIDRAHWEKVDHNPPDTAIWQVGHVVAVDVYGQPTHFEVGSGETEPLISNAKANMRVQEVFKIEEPYGQACYKVLGQVYSSRAGLVEAVASIHNS